MIENVNGRRKTASLRRVALTSLLVASGIGVVGVVPALAANDSSPGYDMTTGAPKVTASTTASTTTTDATTDATATTTAPAGGR
jgi:hypothetical protein